MSYIMHGYEYVDGPDHDKEMRENGYSRPVRREITREFGTAMGMLRFCLDNGAFPNRGASGPLTLERVHLGRDGQGPGSDYQRIDTAFPFKVTAECLSAMRKAHARYMAALHYWREVEPEWREGAPINYADNSTERIDRDKHGNTRRVMLRQPSGDVC